MHNFEISCTARIFSPDDFKTILNAKAGVEEIPHPLTITQDSANWPGGLDRPGDFHSGPTKVS